MTGVPSWMTGPQVTIVKTFNGFAIVQNASDAASQSVSFSTWADLSYYLTANFGAPAP
jgi:hypothetical protein